MTAPDNPVPLKSVKPEEWPERLYGGKAVVRFPSGVESGNWYSKPDAGGDQTREYIRADVALADALAEVERLREELDEAQGLIYAARLERNAAEDQEKELAEELRAVRAERDAALARVEKLRHQITEASDPDFLFGAMDNVNDMDVTLDQFAAAASRAIRAALDEDARHG